MSNASSPRQGGGGPSPSAQGQPIRYNPYASKNGYIAANGFRTVGGQMIPSGMMAVANNGQVIMANQVQIANPATIQARLTNPYMGGVQMGGAQVMMGGAQMIPGAGQMMAGAQVLPGGQMVATGAGIPMMSHPQMSQMSQMSAQMSQGQHAGHHAMGTVMMQMPQMQYVQPPHIAGGATGAGVAYQSQPVSYQSAQTPNTQPPPPPAGNPPKEEPTQKNALSRSSTPQTHPKSEPNVSAVPGTGPGGPGGGGPTSGNGSGGGGPSGGGPSGTTTGQTLGPDFNELNERLQNANKEQRAEIAKLTKENMKMRDKVKKLSRENHAATKSYTVKDGKCPFCLQEMPKNKKT